MSTEKFIELLEDSKLYSYIDDLEKEYKKLKESIIKKEKMIHSLNDFNYKLKQQYELLELNYLSLKKEKLKLENIVLGDGKRK